MMLMQHTDVHATNATPTSDSTCTVPAIRPRSQSLGKISMLRAKIKRKATGASSSKSSEVDHLRVKSSPKLPRSHSSYSNSAMQLNNDDKYDFDDFFELPFRSRVSF